MGGSGLFGDPEAPAERGHLEPRGSRFGEEQGGHRAVVVSAQDGHGRGTQG